MVELNSRCIVHFNAMTHPTNAWVAYSQTPCFLIQDRDGNALRGDTFAQVAKGSSIEILKTPYRAPKANAIRERFLGSAPRECLDHILVLREIHLYQVIKDAKRLRSSTRLVCTRGSNKKFRRGTTSEGKEERKGMIIAFPVLNGLEHDYRRTVRIIESHHNRRGPSFW